jgi:hypothetical protein
MSHLLGGETITKLQALKLFGCMHLGDVIWRLRKRGHDIETIHVTDMCYNPTSGEAVEKTWAKYMLVEV